MRTDSIQTARGRSRPATRAELRQWVRENLPVPEAEQCALLDAIDRVFENQERLWAQSKQDAIQAVTAGFSARISSLRQELTARDATVSGISAYFEGLVADLTNRAHHDSKTRLMNFGHFIERLEAFLTLDRRSRWCAVGLVDITSFKSYNDTLGHAIGDQIIERVASLLREQVRSDDLIAQESVDPRGTHALHARFGGDEFCFLVPDVSHPSAAVEIAERFRRAVTGFDWSTEDARLAERPVAVDVGVVCLRLGPVTQRRQVARQLAHDMLSRADALMYQAKSAQALRVHQECVKVVNGGLIECADTDTAG